MALFSACVVGAVAMAVFACSLAFLAIEAVGMEATVQRQHDPKHTIWEERQALRVLRARYAQGRVSAEDYRWLCYELEGKHPG